MQGSYREACARYNCISASPRKSRFSQDMQRQRLQGIATAEVCVLICIVSETENLPEALQIQITEAHKRVTSSDFTGANTRTPDL